MAKQQADAKALKVAKALKNADNWKHLARWNGEGYYELKTEDTGDVPVRLFLTPTLFADAEDILYRYLPKNNRPA
ncbi:MAG TPA: hypothetical protein VIW80_02250 [Pyrinomonadaceae bacterium]|jgi:tRNA-splicing ligase RtcB